MKFTVGLAVASMLSPLAQAETLEEALKLARNNTPELAELAFDAEKAEAEVAAIDSAYDPWLFGSMQTANDRTEAQNSFSGDQRKNRGAQIGVRKLYGTGTWGQVSYGYDQTRIEYPETPATPGIPVIPSGQKYNPGVTNKLEAQLNQPLLRNYMGKEIELQKEAAAIGSKSARNIRSFKEQAVQLEVEQLYLAASKLKQQIKLTNELIGKTKKFRKLMEQRMSIGRADQVDVATAESGIVTQEGRLLSLEIGLEETLTRLSDKLGIPTRDVKINQANLDKSLLALPISTQVNAMNYAKSHRFDLKNLADSRTSLNAQSMLTLEKSRPKLDAFVSATRSGLDENMGDSTAKIVEKNHSQFAIGLKFEMNLGGTDSHYNKIANAAQSNKIDAQEKTILADVNRNLRLAWLTMSASKKQSEQATRQVSSLKKQESAERKKFLQARTDEIGAIRFEIEALSAESGLIDANYNARSAEANIRFVIHAYPSEN